MKLYRFEATQTVPVTLDTAWAFFSDPHNLERITPPALHLVVSEQVPHTIYPGLLIPYRVRLLVGVRVHWLTEITHVIERRLFVDEQRFGPYRFWQHQHHFREIGGAVELCDIVHYLLPFRGIGRLSAGRIQRQIAHIFAFRHQKIEQLFGFETQ